MSGDLDSAQEKALKINLDAARYGTFAEIGAGQEVARWFFQAGKAVLLQIREQRDAERDGGTVRERYAAMPKTLWMNWRCATTSPLATQRIWSFRIACIAS